MEWHSTSGTVSHLPPAGVAEEGHADFTFGDDPSAGPTAVEDESQ